MTTEIVRIPVNADSAGALVEQVHAARDTYFASPACVDFRVLRSTSGDEVTVVVDWASPQAHEQANATSAARAFFVAVQNLAAGAPELSWHESV